MIREQIENELLSVPNSNILCELPTSFGKTNTCNNAKISTINAPIMPTFINFFL